jgi:eukaryotic-like serine/threonine-protein kinase
MDTNFGQLLLDFDQGEDRPVPHRLPDDVERPFQKNLRSILEKEPPPPGPYRVEVGPGHTPAEDLAPKIWRHPVFVAGLFVLLLAGMFATTWQTVEAKRAERVALAAQQAATRARDQALAAEQQAEQARNEASVLAAQALQDRDRALREQQRAETEAATARAANAFLENDPLSQADAAGEGQPYSPSDPDVKIRTALDRAATRLEGRFAAEPLIEASIRQSIGKSYHDLGLYPEARSQLERALDLRRRKLGTDHPDTTSTMTSLAVIYREQSEYGKAEQLLTNALELQRRVLGREHPDTLSTMRATGELYSLQGNYAQAEKMFTSMLRIAPRVLGREHPETVGAMNDLASTYQREGKDGQAEQLLIKIREIQRRAPGENRPKPPP